MKIEKIHFLCLVFGIGAIVLGIISIVKATYLASSVSEMLFPLLCIAIGLVSVALYCSGYGQQKIIKSILLYVDQDMIKEKRKLDITVEIPLQIRDGEVVSVCKETKNTTAMESGVM